MAIRLSNNCSNCSNLMNGEYCATHKVMVNTHYTCDSFEMRADLKDQRNCVSCSRFEKTDCANPEKAAPNMLCTSWAPQAQA